MDMSKRFVTIGAALVIILGFAGPCFSQDDQDLVIRTYLYKADIQGSRFSKKDLAAFLDSPPLLSLRRGASGAGANDYETMGRMIGSLFRIPNIIFLTSADMPWEGSRENFNEAVTDGFDIYPIQLYRRSVSPESVRLKVEALRFEFAELSYTDTRSHLERKIGVNRSYQVYGNPKRIADDVGGIKWLDAEVSIPVGSSLILALPTDDRAVFCALKLERKSDKTMDIGFLGEKILSLIIGGTDPVCGKPVIKGNERKEASELKAALIHKGEFYYFCSEECRAKFEADADRYLKKAVFRRNVAALSPGALAPRPKIAVVPDLASTDSGGRRTSVGRAEFDLDECGRIAAVRAALSDGSPLDPALREVLDQWRFEPSTENGKATASTYTANISVSAADAAEEYVAAVPSASDARRPDVLAKAEEYCRKIENAALYFVCRERIVETIYPSDELEVIRVVVRDRIKGGIGTYMGSTGVPSGDSTFVYDYQLIHQDGRIREKRRLIEENGVNPAAESNYPKTRRFHVERAVLGPVGLFGREAQARFQYRILDETRLDGRPVATVEVKPKSGVAGGPVYGKAWLDKATGAVLKMEIEAESFSGYDRIAAEYTSRGFRPSVSFEIAYGHENGGLFFPSRIRFKESCYGVGVSGLTIDYDRYKFFTVGTEVIIK